jgi:putative salt-induced outer membrane protein YdiY
MTICAKRKREIMRSFVLFFLINMTLSLSQIAIANEGQVEADQKKFDVGVTIGGSRDTGSTDTSKARLSIDSTYRADSVTSEFKSLYQYEEKSGESNQNRLELAVNESLVTGSRWAPFITDKFTWDEIKGIDYDNNIGAGVKYLLFSKNGGKISLSGSILYQLLKYEDLPEDENTAYALESVLKWGRGDIKVMVDFYYQASAEDSENYKFNSDFKLTYFLNSMLGLSTEFSSRYRNITPEGTPKQDTTTVFSVTLAY